MESSYKVYFLFYRSLSAGNICFHAPRDNYLEFAHSRIRYGVIIDRALLAKQQCDIFVSYEYQDQGRSCNFMLPIFDAENFFHVGEQTDSYKLCLCGIERNRLLLVCLI
jgi:hypothetical protein